MSKLVFFNILAYGHTNPTLGVVRELVARGNQVWYYSFAPFQKVIQEAGATFVPCDDAALGMTPSPEDSARVGKDLAFSIDLIVRATLALDEKICRDMERIAPDGIVADSMAFWGKLAAQKLGIPFLSSTTTFAFNRASAKVMGQGMGNLFSMVRAMPKIHRSLRRLRAYGYPVKNVFSILENDNATHTIVYTSRYFQPAVETFSPRYVFVGPSLRPIRQPLAPSPQKTVYISLGTVNNQNLPFYRSCLTALGETPYRVVMAVGRESVLHALGPLPANVQAEAMGDQIGVLAAADVFLTHCGMNSVSEALFFGVPLVCCPQTQEQRGVANRVLALGAGLLLPDDSPQAIAQAIGIALSDPGYRAHAATIAQSFRESGGAPQAAETILQVIAQDRATGT
mgnify:FL=1